MDIVSRLKDFRESLNMSVTQFADVCGIPRPTMSQLLSGRNKKVSDELLRKFHQQFPQLNLMWLLFGEGDMLRSSNIEISEPESHKISSDTPPQSPAIQNDNPTLDFEYDNINFTPNNFGDSPELFSGIESQPFPTSKNISDPEKTAPNTTTISFSSDSEKKIVNIIVYYNDNSFESFIPGLPSTSHK